MTAMAPPFIHPGNMPSQATMHPAMAPGHPSNQGIPASMAQQMQAGMAGGPGGPQVSQGGNMIGAIPQGMGPGGAGPVPQTHAMLHLQPGNPQQQQQQMFAQQPQMAASMLPAFIFHRFL
jgi:hypothetical protein